MSVRPRAAHAGRFNDRERIRRAFQWHFAPVTQFKRAYVADESVCKSSRVSFVWMMALTALSRVGEVVGRSENFLVKSIRCKKNNVKMMAVYSSI